MKNLFVLFFLSFFFFFFPFHSFSQCISAFPYFENFDSGNGGWSSGGTNSDWAYGTPSKPVITGAGSGSFCWNLGGLTGSFYNFSEQSYVVSPCYDFSSLTNPHISFQIFWEIERKFDGGNLQYSTNGGTAWTNVGAYGDVVDCMDSNWYNYPSVKYLNTPAWITPNEGWSGDIQPTVGICVGGFGSGAWVTAQHCMPYLAGLPNVMFRFTAGSGTTCNSYDGISFDDVLIENAPVNVPFFTSSCSGNVISFSGTGTPCPTSFSWNFGDAASGTADTSSLQNPSHTYSTSGIYTVSLTTNGPCNPAGTITKTIDIILANITSQTNVSCNGANNGSATVTVSGGTSPYSYLWSTTPAQTNPTATGLSAGTYSVTVNSAFSACPAISSVTIIQQGGFTVSSSQTNVSCNGGTDGTLAVTATGGSSPYSYLWNTGAQTQNIASLAAGNYSVTITDSNNCIATTLVTITQPALLTATATATATSCNGGNDGTALVTAGGGSSPYSYLWSNGVTQSQISNLTSQIYSVTITDSNNCTATTSVTITQPVVLTAAAVATAISCNGGNDGSVTLTVNGGTSPYSYLWNTGVQTQNIASLTPGNYSVTVTDFKNCTNAISVVITQPSALTVVATALATSCNGGNDGSAAASANGGTSPYSFFWSNGATQSAISNLQATAYSVTVADANGCTASDSIVITEPGAIVTTISGSSVVCTGQSTLITASATGGNGNYSYVWIGLGNGASQLVTPPSDTTYTVVVTDAKGCNDTAQILIKVNPPIIASFVAPDTICSGDSASVSISASGGAGSFTFNWLNPPIGTGPGPFTVMPIVTTSYLVSVSDTCSNSVLKSVTIVVNPKPSAVIVAQPTEGCEPLTVNFASDTLGNPVGTTYQWSFGDGTTATSPFPVHTFLDSGIFQYGFTAITPQGCRAMSNNANTIIVHPQPKAGFSASPQPTTLDSSVIYFTNTSQGANNYFWNFGDGTTSSQENPQHNYSDTGKFTVILIVTNNFGCRDTFTMEIIILPLFKFFVPNAFTPGNGDEKNDFFQGKGICMADYEMYIFDRWGEEIYHTIEYDKPWDGHAKGGEEVVQIGVYVYLIDVLDCERKKHRYIGHVTVVR